jgi:O-antigen chain-terminating methyltransferase
MQLPKSDMTNDFYRAFEDRHRGTRELIKSRLQVYVPFVEPLRSIYEDCKAVDLGCGRGEWLEILRENGFDAMGVDLDDGMLAACEDLGLPAERGEAIAHLRTIPDESLTVVSGFHIAEHIAFADLQILVQEALRVLRPAGLLILETPNPENIVVGTAGFYIDPTHQRPLPPLLLSFLP